MSPRTRPPFRADHVGSLLRPKRLVEARAARSAGTLSADRLRAVDNACVPEAIKLQQKIGYLSLIGNIAPMMGLFGTVSGMITAFQTIAEKGASVTPADLAGGISQALVTTFLGLFVAIPTMIAYFFFRNKVVRITLEIHAIADDLVERFRGK